MDSPEQEQRDRFPQWAGEFASTAAANAVGTLTAGLILFLGGVLIGAIDNVSTRVIVGVALATVSLVVMLAAGARLARLVPQYRRARKRQWQMERPVERAHEAFETAKRSATDQARFEAQVALARQALARGDDLEAARLVEEMERDAASASYAVDQARRYIEEAEAAVEHAMADRDQPG